MWWFLVTPETVAWQASPSTGFSRQEYWSGLLFPSPGESSRPRDWTQVSCISSRFFTDWAMREALFVCGGGENTDPPVLVVPPCGEHPLDILPGHWCPFTHHPHPSPQWSAQDRTWAHQAQPLPPRQGSGPFPARSPGMTSSCWIPCALLSTGFQWWASGTVRDGISK